MNCAELIKQLQEIKRDFGNLEVCVNFDPHDRRWGWPADYAEAVDVVTDTRRDLVKYVGNATLDGPVGKADDQVVFIRLV